MVVVAQQILAVASEAFSVHSWFYDSELGKSMPRKLPKGLSLHLR